MARPHRLGEPVGQARMRPAVLLVTAATLVLLAAFVFVGGRDVARQSAATATAPATAIPIEPAATVETAPRRLAAPSRQVAPDIAAPTGLDADQLEWTAPRQPLSELSLALPPKPPAPKPLLFRPVAEEAGVISAGGSTVTIDGIAIVESDEVCTAQSGKEWPCGRAARTAFRAFLRGRAVTCDFPEGEVPNELTVPCWLGKQDAGAWLVTNGWARAAEGGPYVEAQKAAQAARKGIFGPGPDISGLKPVQDFTASTPPVAQPEPAE